jgi:hypothetical protein
VCQHLIHTGKLCKKVPVSLTWMPLRLILVDVKILTQHIVLNILSSCFEGTTDVTTPYEGI